MSERSLITLVCGAPGAGKTLCATALGMDLCRITGRRVLVLYADPVCPPLPLLFPGADRDRAGTLGRVLEKTRPSRSDVLREILTDRRAPDLGFLGFSLRDAPDAYPLFGDARCRELYDVLGTLCPYVIVDGCSGPERDVLTKIGLGRADAVLRLRPAGPMSAVYDSVHPDLGKNVPLNLDVRVALTPDALIEDGDRPDADLPYAPSIRERLWRGLGPCGSFRDKAYRAETTRLSHILAALMQETGEETLYD